MRTPLIFGLAIALVASTALAKAPSVSVSSAWTRPVAKGQMAAGYMTVTNTGKAADKLVAVSSPGARAVTMHQSMMQGDIATMRPVEGGVELKPGQTVTFAPGGYHLMIEGVKADEKLGATLPVVLSFAHAGQVKVAFKVAETAPK